MTTTADIQAVTDVVNAFTNESDSLTIEQGVEFLDVLNELKKAVATAIGMTEMHMCSILESPRIINGKQYEVKSAGKWRPDHDSVRAAVKRASIADPETGEMRTAFDAAEEAMELMYSLYVAPSSMPKTGALEKLGLDKGDVADYERAGIRLSVTEVPSEVA
jgi:hypothetical protein